MSACVACAAAGGPACVREQPEHGHPGPHDHGSSFGERRRRRRRYALLSFPFALTEAAQTSARWSTLVLLLVVPLWRLRMPFSVRTPPPHSACLGWWADIGHNTPPPQSSGPATRPATGTATRFAATGTPAHPARSARFAPALLVGLTDCCAGSSQLSPTSRTGARAGASATESRATTACSRSTTATRTATTPRGKSGESSRFPALLATLGWFVARCPALCKQAPHGAAASVHRFHTQRVFDSLLETEDNM